MRRIFFLINNNFHWNDMREHLHALGDYEVNLICIPHTLDPELQFDGVHYVWRFESPFAKKRLGILNLRNTASTHDQIKKALNIMPSDVLLMYTEFELLNQYVAMTFKRAGAKVFLLDEGLGTYIVCSQKSDAKLPVKSWLHLRWSKYVIGYTWLRYMYFNNRIRPYMDDALIDGVLLYRDVVLSRKFPAYRIHGGKDNLILSLDATKCLFVNSPTYQVHSSWDAYCNDLLEVFATLQRKFSQVYFKFHPRESKQQVEAVKRLLSNFDKVCFVEDAGPVEDLLQTVQAKYAVSFISTSLLSLADKGVEPIYVFQLIDSLRGQSIVAAMSALLSSIGVHLIDSLDDISIEATYVTRERVPEKSLVDALNEVA